MTDVTKTETEIKIEAVKTIEIPVPVLKAILSGLRKAVHSSSTRPVTVIHEVLSSLVIEPREVRAGNFTFEATLRLSEAFEGDEDFAVRVPFKALNSLAGLVRGKGQGVSIRLSYDAADVTVRDAVDGSDRKDIDFPAKVKMEIIGQNRRLEVPVPGDVDETGLPPQKEGEDYVLFSIQDLAYGYQRRMKFLAMGMSREETRYYLNGVAIHGGEIPGFASPGCMCATNGHMLMVHDLDIPEGFEGKTAIIPMDTVDFITATPLLKEPDPSALVTNLLIGDPGDPEAEEPASPDPVEIDITITGLDVAGVKAAMEIRSRLVDGNYPDVGRVIPKFGYGPGKNGRAIGFLANADEMASALQDISKLMKATTDEGGRIVRFTQRVEDGRLDLESGIERSGTAGASLDVEFLIGAKDGYLYGYNPKYLHSVISGLRTVLPAHERLKFQAVDCESPALITLDEAGDTALAVLMPVRVK